MESYVLEKLTHCRWVSANHLRKLAGRVQGQCTWCGGPLPSHRRRWCSRPCEVEFEVRFRPTMIRFHVERRDLGICAGCGLDSKAIRRRLSVYRVADTKPIALRVQGGRWLKNRRGRRNLRRAANWLRCQRALSARTGWEAHHRVAVVDGGGALGLDNIETLCDRCHDCRTAALAARRAKPRPEKPPLFDPRQTSLL